MDKDPKEREDEEIHEDANEESIAESRNEDEEDGMKERFPNSTRESRNAGRFLGSDFPYVPGDPFW